MAKGRARSRRLSAFMLLSLDGYYADRHGDMSFAHKCPDDAEWNEFLGSNASGDAVLLFGRTTYDMMVAWWPTPMAAQAMPTVAAGMNAAPKVVFSRSMKNAAWNNTVVERDLVGAVRRLKAEPGPDLVILGSGGIVTQLAEAGLMDEIQVVVCPVALGGGKAFLGGLGQRLDLSVTRTRVFANGSVAIWYAPA